jgi:hypothetical protein
MNSIDLVERLVPHPQHTLVIETGSDLYLVDTERAPAASDTVLGKDDAIQTYDASQPVFGVAYCVIHFLS